MTYIAPKEITVWVCPKCGYWREHRTTGVHQVFPDRGPGQIHPLVPRTYEVKS